MMGLYYEESEIGQKWRLGSYHFTREAVLRFARAYDPQVFHIDDDAAAESHFGRLAASGWHTASGWMRCYVEADDTARKARIAQGDVLPEHGPSPGVTNLKWIKPVYPGDTVTYWMEITAKREMVSRPRWGLATKHSEGFNQNGELVFAFDGKVMVQRKIPV
jgi:acyl dehydratase